MPNPWFVFLGMAVVTFLTRYVGVVAAGRTMPVSAQRWLHYVPIAVLAALIAPAALAPGGQAPSLSATLAMAVGLIAAWRTRNAFWTIVAGMAAYWLLRLAGVT